MNEELKQIKKLYGEEMMHLCRDLFPTILETPGLLLSTLKKNIAPSRSTYRIVRFYDVKQNFKNWIFSLISDEEQKRVKTNKDPFELMDEAGYILYECKSEADIQKFKKYYARGEELCTFSGGRLERCHVFFAVKKNVDEIKRENFPKPQREDKYGTSVISIQFSRGLPNVISIKNRYNHTVNNPDATFSNNLENIIPGLTDSFIKKYNFNITQQNDNSFEEHLSYIGYVKARDGRYYYFIEESNGIYYCEDNYIIKDGEVITKYHDNPERYILINKTIIDLKEKTVKNFDNRVNDAFTKSINDVGKISKITVTKDTNYKKDGITDDKERKIITIYYEDNKEIKITINESNIVVGYENDYVEEIGDEFLIRNHRIDKLSLKKVKKIGHDFLKTNAFLTSISLPEAESIGDDFIFRNRIISEVDLPKLKKVGDYFLDGNVGLSNLCLPELELAGSRFLYDNQEIKSISLPKLESVGDFFIPHNVCLKDVSLPSLKITSDYFLSKNQMIERISLPEVESIGKCFMGSNLMLRELSLPKVKRVGDYFLCDNKMLEKLSMPIIEYIGDYYLIENKVLHDINMPETTRRGHF